MVYYNNKVREISLFNYHSHTVLCGHALNTVEEMVLSAIDKNFSEIGISEHYGSSWFTHTIWPEKVDYYFSECNRVKEKYKDKIKVKIGVELDWEEYNHNIRFKDLQKYDLDYILGSVHQINNVGITGNEFYADKTENEAYTQYFQALRELVCTNMFNCVAHFDFIKRGANSYYGEFKPEIYKELICDVINEIVKRNMCIEINTNGYHWNDLNDFYPNIKILEWYKELGGKYITYGSDSHKIGHLGTKINEIYDIIRSLGFKDVATYNKRIVQPVSINE